MKLVRVNRMIVAFALILYKMFSYEFGWLVFSLRAWAHYGCPQGTRTGSADIHVSHLDSVYVCVCFGSNNNNNNTLYGGS